MKTRLAKMLSSFALATALSLPCVTTYAAEAYDNEYISSADICDTSVWGIEDYADNVKDVYFMCYPEMTDVIVEIVDGYLSDNEFVAAFEEMGASAFLIVEDAIHKAIEPEAAPVIFEADTYFSRHSIPLIQQKVGYNDGASAAVLMALYGCGCYDYYKNESSSFKDSQQYTLINEISWDANKRTTISEVTRTLRRYYNKSSVLAFQTKKATTFTDMLRMLTTSLDVDAAPVIRLPDGNDYYYAVVDSIIDTDEVEDLTIIDPRTGKRRSFSFDELKSLLFPDDIGVVWMSVYNVDKSKEAIEQVKSEYPSYFTQTKGACTDHKIYHPENSKTCKYWDGGWQCAGFGRYVFQAVKGRTYLSSRGSTITGFGSQLANPVIQDDNSFSGTSLTADTARKYLQGLPTGAYIRVRTSGGTRHSVAVLNTSDTGIEVYQANYGGNCVIKTSTYTWSEFAAAFPHLFFYVD